ncbi:Schwann cell myelin protein-like [Seriola dumerili]|uniref:Schwann cell myelin protein-like n=1 Tax=Seriola dumerili TaxID=41447 RepID=UPI000BBE50E9|nr:Schwann cell myelin protein-like [Seriola dumerili]XP_022593728.1 Schwann cell myelin protein-like [Seriola dumerili]
MKSNSFIMFANRENKFLSVNTVTINVLLSVLFISGDLAPCDEPVFFITTPEKMEALTGSCLQIPCNFGVKSEEELKTTHSIGGVWIKRDSRFATFPENVIFNSSSAAHTYPVNITGNLREKNCTTIFSNLTTFYTDRFFFRIEIGSFVATAVCHSLQINVNDSALSPKIEITGDLREGESVNITCSALTPCPRSPPKLTWDLQQDPRNKKEENTDRTVTTKIRQTITLSEKHDGYNITCSASYPVNEGRHFKTAKHKITLSVLYAPKDTSASISPSGLVPAGSWVNLTCSSRAKPPIRRFTWFKQSTDGPMNVSEGHFYSFRATYGAVYYCVATNDVGNHSSLEIRLLIKGEGLQWEPVLGGVIGVIFLICLIVCVWRLKSTRQTQSQTSEELVIEESASKTEEENIHYGEIDFSKLRPAPSSDSLQDSGQQQDTVYAQVKVSETANSSKHTADSPEDLYAQVMKK